MLDNLKTGLQDAIKKFVGNDEIDEQSVKEFVCLLYTSPSPRDQRGSGVGGCGC